MTRPTIQESLCAAAYAILTDHYDHAEAARKWAVRQLRHANGRRTAFQAQIAAAARNGKAVAHG